MGCWGVGEIMLNDRENIYLGFGLQESLKLINKGSANIYAKHL